MKAARRRDKIGCESATHAAASHVDNRPSLPRVAAGSTRPPTKGTHPTLPTGKASEPLQLVVGRARKPDRVVKAGQRAPKTARASDHAT